MMRIRMEVTEREVHLTNTARERGHYLRISIVVECVMVECVMVERVIVECVFVQCVFVGCKQQDRSMVFDCLGDSLRSVHVLAEIGLQRWWKCICRVSYDKVNSFVKDIINGLYRVSVISPTTSVPPHPIEWATSWPTREISPRQ